MRRYLVLTAFVLGLLLAAAIMRVAASVFLVAPEPEWVADGTDAHGDPLPEGAVARLGTVRFRSTTFTNLCWLDDGRIAAGGFDDEIVIWDGETGERTQVLAGHRGQLVQPLQRWDWREVRSAVLEGEPPTRSDYLRWGHIEQAGHHLISAGATVREWDLRTGAGRVLVHPRGGNVSWFELLDDGNVIRFTVGRREYRVDRRTGKRTRRKLPDADADRRIMTTVDRAWTAFTSPDDASIRLVRTSDGSERTIPRPHPEVFSRHGALSEDGTRLWWIWGRGGRPEPGVDRLHRLTVSDTGSGTTLATVELSGSGDSSNWWWVSCSPEGRFVATTSDGGRAQLRDATTLEVIRELDAPRARLHAAAFSPDSQRVALRFFGGTGLALFDVATGERLRPSVAHEAAVHAAVFLDDDRVLTAGEDGTHRAWEVRTGRLLWTRRTSLHESLAIAPSGDTIAVATAKGALTVRTDDGSVVAERTKPEGWQTVGIAPDGTLLLESERAIALLAPDADAPRVIVERGVAADSQEGRRTNQLAWDAERRRLLLEDETRKRDSDTSWSTTTVLRAIDTTDGATVWTLGEMLSDPVSDIRHDAVAVAAWGLALLIDGEGNVVRRIRVPGAAIEAVAVSPDGARIATGDSDSVVQLWSVATGARLRTLRGHGGTVCSLTWSPDGTLLVSTSTDTTALVWDVAD